MTREEAIEILQGAIKKPNTKDGYLGQALDMAIKALEQEPLTESDDCVSRGQLDKCLYELRMDNIYDMPSFWCHDNKDYRVIPTKYYKGYEQAIMDIEEKIAKLPSVQPKPKTGHWILQPSNKEQDERDFIWWKCSECGQVIYSESEKDRREYHAFCGRCGARMESEDKS